MSIDILKLATFGILVYLGVQLYIGQAQNNYNLACTLNNLRLSKSSLSNNNFYGSESERILLSEEEENNLIRKYGEKEYSIKSSEDCAIGVGYTTCMDIGFSAVDLI